MDKLNWSTVANMINYYKTNNVSKLTPDQIECMNLVRDIFVKADPLSVNVTKRFQSDEELVEYYGNLEKQYSGVSSSSNKTTKDIFDQSFITSPIMKTYASKFYKRHLNLAASHLSEVFKYQMATAITQNKPLPLFNIDTTHDYLKTLYHKADMPPNVQQAMVNKSNERLSVCTDVINNVVDDLLYGTHNGYYINTTLYPNVRTAVHRFRHNITHLLNCPLTLSTNIYNLIETKTNLSKNIDYKPLERVEHQNSQIPVQQHLTEMAFENEALRRAKIQEMNIKYANLLNKK
nr:gp41 [Cnaphalocrocis medinalis granulovirus]